MIPQDLQYDFPLASYGMLCIFAFIILFAGYKIYKSHLLQRYAENSSLARLLIGQSSFNFWAKAGVICVAWILAIIALMQPKGDAHYIDELGNRKKDQSVQTTKKRKLHDVIFLLDASASMAVPDGRNGSTRLKEAKEIIDQIAARLGGEQAALYAFTSDVTQLAPPTMDILFVRLMAQQVRINEGGIAGTNISEALKSIHERFLSQATPGFKTIILLSDGGDTAIESLSGTEKQQAIKDVLQYVQAADPRTVRVFTIGLGTKEGGKVPGIKQDVISKLDSSLLKAISNHGHGRYYSASELSVIDIAKDITNLIQSDDLYYEVGEEGYSIAQENPIVYSLYFQVPLAFALLLLMMVVLIPDTIRKALVLMVCLLPLNADQLETAQRWYEAGAYEQAIEIYKELLDNALTPYENSVVRYNLGTALLGEGKWDDAVAIFRSIDLNNASPLVKQRVNANTIVARMREEAETEDLPKRIFLLREGLRNIFQGDVYHCQLAEIIQSPTCMPSSNLAEMRALIENEISTVLTHLQQYQIANVNFIEGIPLLYSYVKKMRENVLFLQNKAKTPELEASYQQLFLSIMGSWMPLWNKLHERPDPPQRFINARQFHRDAQTNLRVGDYRKALQYLEAAQELLADLMKSNGVSTPEQESLQQLLRSYQLALLQEPVQEVALQGLQQEQKLIRSDALKTANQAIQSAVLLAGSGKPEEARIQVEVAQQEVRNILRRKAGELSPLVILEASIEAQEHALNLARLVDQAQANAGRQSLDQAQQQVVEIATPFFQEVIQQQKKEYDATGVCQKHPWESAVPLFYEGLQFARTAVSAERKISWQEQALASWKQSLEALKEEPEESEKKAESESDKVLRNLQQMEQNDLQPLPPIEPSGLEQKPW